MGLEQIQLFDFVYRAYCRIIGMMFLWLVAPRLLPETLRVRQRINPNIWAALNVNEGEFTDGKTCLKSAGVILKSIKLNARILSLQKSLQLSLRLVTESTLNTLENLQEYQDIRVEPF